jgi:hypothetical protein
MYESFKIIQRVAEYTEQLLADECHSINSIEIKQSAESFQQSIQPCLKETEKFVASLNTHIQRCLRDLSKAEDIWQSKQKIADVSSLPILEQIGLLAGYRNRLPELAKRHKIKLYEEHQKYSNKQIESLQQEHFFDKPKQTLRDEVNIIPKNSFTDDVASRVFEGGQQLNRQLKSSINELAQVLPSSSFNEIRSLGVSLDKLAEANHSLKIDELLKDFRFVTERPPNYIQNLFLVEFTAICEPTLQEWRRRIWAISRQELAVFKQEADLAVKHRIDLILDNRTQAIQKVLDQMIELYDDFLERQKRYRQETDTERKAEKGWLVTQREPLEQLHAQVQAILQGSDRP